MAEAKDIPSGTYNLELGSTFTDDQRRRSGPSFHTLRYDFKPSSVASDSETYIAYGGNGDVHVALPTDGDNLTVFKGSKKDAKPKECLLFFDKRTNTVRLEKIASSINVKKTRDLDANTEASLRSSIERLRTTQTPRPPSPVHEANTSRQRQSSSSSSSSSGSDSDSDSSDDDSNGNPQKRDSSGSDEDENNLLEEMNNSKATTSSKAEPVFQNMPNFDLGGNVTSKSRKGQADLGLVLSESSDED